MVKFIVLIIVLNSCGSSKTSGESSDAAVVEPKGDVFVGAKLFDAKADLPSCNDATIRQLVYVVEENQFYYCKPASWIAIDLKGPQGAPGPTTTAIATSTGTDSSSNNILLRIHYLHGCEAAHNFNSTVVTVDKTITMTSSDYLAMVSKNITCVLRSITSVIFDCSYVEPKTNASIRFDQVCYGTPNLSKLGESFQTDGS